MLDKASEINVLGLVMDIFNLLTVNLYGANINKRTVENIRIVGFTDIEVINLIGDIVKKIIITNKK